MSWLGSILILILLFAVIVIGIIACAPCFAQSPILTGVLCLGVIMAATYFHFGRNVDERLQEAMIPAFLGAMELGLLILLFRNGVMALPGYVGLGVVGIGVYFIVPYLTKLLELLLMIIVICFLAGIIGSVNDEDWDIKAFMGYLAHLASHSEEFDDE